MIDQGKRVVYPLVDALSKALDKHKLIIGTGGGARTRHVFSIGLDLGLPTGVLAGLSIADALGNAHILGTLLASRGVVAIPPEIFGHLLPFFSRVPLALFSTAIRRMPCGNIRPPSGVSLPIGRMRVVI